jgi:hypothetical protein
LVTIFPDNVSRTISLIMSRNPIPDEPEVAVLPEVKPESLPILAPILDPITVGNNGQFSVK